MIDRRRGLYFLLILCLLFLPIAGSAQTAASATLSTPNLTAFPRIEAYLDVRDGQGRFMHGLQPQDVRLLEDGQPVAAAEFREVRPGAQVVFAVNPGATFGRRDSQGLSRYEYLVEALRGWIKARQGSTLDDLSLIFTGGTEISHLSDPAEWLAALEAEQIDARAAAPSLDILFRAVDFAADNPPRPGMGRAVLFVTAPFEGRTPVAIEDLASVANQQGVHISVWLITATGAPLPAASEPLVELAEATGGSFFTYVDGEPFPDLEDFLDGVRSVYALAYDSHVQMSGVHQLVASVQTPGGELTTPATNFSLEILPPDPAFVSPVLEIERKPLEVKGLPIGEPPSIETYQPAQQPLQILIDFPDGRMRSLQRSALYVDGELVEERTEPPFDRFNWDLSGYENSGEHLLQVEVQDTLGLTGTSMEVAVHVLVARPKSTTTSALYQHAPELAGLTVLIGGSVLLLALLLRGRIGPRNPLKVISRRRQPDPATLPAPVKSEAGSRLSGLVNRLQRHQRQAAPRAFAFLSRLSDLNGYTSATPVPVSEDLLIIGHDPSQANLVLDDPSIEAAHACLTRLADGTFWIADQGSIAGTWINYTPVSSDGIRLEHGDLVHFGRLGFRFTLRHPGQVRKPVVKLQEQDKELQH